MNGQQIQFDGMNNFGNFNQMPMNQRRGAGPMRNRGFGNRTQGPYGKSLVKDTFRVFK